MALAIAACLPAYAVAAEPTTTREAVISFDIPAGDLSVALERFSAQSGIQVMYRQELVTGKRAIEIKGSYPPSSALNNLLATTGVSSERVNDKTFVLKATPAKAPALQKKSPETKRPESARESAEARAKDLEAMVVVGSRLGTSPVESAMPITVIDRDQIDRSGAGNIAQVLSYLSEVSVNNSGDRSIGQNDGVGGNGNSNSTTVQMRGMPRGTTLVLINGRRAGESASFSDSGQFDLSTIPLSLVERIEVLPAGSSAVYGGDGLAGVVNIVLRRDANGLELQYRKSFANGYVGSQAGLMWGRTWAKADLSIALSWRKNGALLNSERSLTADHDYRRFGGQDYRNSSSYPATVYSLAGCPPAPDLCEIPIDQRANLPGLNSPVAVVPRTTNGMNLTPSDFLGTQGQVNLTTDLWHFRSPEESKSVAINGRIQVSPNLEVFAELGYTKRDVPAWEVSLWSFLGSYAYKNSRVPASNPYNPFGVDVGVDYVYQNTGKFTSFYQNNYRVALGSRGKVGRFDWELSGWQARDQSGSLGSTEFDTAALNEALASRDPNSTINVFTGDGSTPASSEFLESLLLELDHRASNRSTGVTGYVRGPIAELPTGKLTGLFGMEGQEISFWRSTNNLAYVAPNIRGSSRSRATFAEARLPILAARPGEAMETLAMTGAMRRESSDRFAEPTRTETVGLEIRPFQSLLLRSTYSTAFRPLLTYHAVQNPRENTQFIRDPRFNGLRYRVKVLTAGGTPPGLRPESSTNQTFGLLYRPSSDWNISLTHWEMKFVDRIMARSLQAVLEDEQYYSGRVTRDPQTGLVTQVDARQLNVAKMSSAGTDIGVDGLVSTSIGDFQPSIAATYTYRYEQQNTSQSLIVSSLARYNIQGWAPRWKIVPRVSWDNRHGIRTMLTGKYISAYRDPVALRSGPNIGSFQTLGKFWTFDLNVDIAADGFVKNDSFLSKARLNIGATNLLNRLPDFCAACSARGYDVTQYDIDGRTVYAELRMGF